MNELMAFAKERIEILGKAAAQTTLKGGHNVWAHRKAEVDLLLEKMTQIKYAEPASNS